MNKEELLRCLLIIKSRQLQWEKEKQTIDYSKLTEDPSESYGPEKAHYDADSLVLEFINDKAITKAFNSIEKYYD